MKKGNIRLDIQYLRTLAVISVVFFHARIFSLRGGFLGVDVFFAISGFLVTGMVLRSLERDSFSFLDFYLRRIDRLLPAALSTFLATTVLGAFLLTSKEWSDYLDQLVGALTFTSNFALAGQSGYFDSDAIFKPLLHIWSLSLEEQFYFILPFLLCMVSRRYRLTIIIVGLLVSFLFCQILLLGVPGFPIRLTGSALQKLAFYMLPARAWELLVGSAAAGVVCRRGAAELPKWVRWSALTAIMLVIVMPLDPIHPRLDAAIAVIATAIILLGSDDWIGRSRLLLAIGDWSYSIYLVHWPLFAFAAVIYIGEPPAVVRTALVIPAIVLGWMQFRYIETPFRHGQWRRNKRLVWGAATLVGAVTMTTLAGAINYQPHVVPPDNGLSASCGMGAGILGTEPCQSGPSPTVAVWGDSFAMQWVQSIAKIEPVWQLTHHGCPPLDDLALQAEGDVRAGAAACAALQRKALRELTETKAIKTVVLSGSFLGYFDDGAGTLVGSAGDRRAQPRFAVRALSDAIETLQSAGKRVILIAHVPSTQTDWAECNRRLREGLFSIHRSCSFAVADSQEKWRSVDEMLRETGRRYQIPVLWPSPPVRNGRYMTAINSIGLFFNDSHISEVGAQLLSRNMGLTAALLSNEQSQDDRL